MRNVSADTPARMPATAMVARTLVWRRGAINRGRNNDCENAHHTGPGGCGDREGDLDRMASVCWIELIVDVPQRYQQYDSQGQRTEIGE